MKNLKICNLGALAAWEKIHEKLINLAFDSGEIHWIRHLFKRKVSVNGDSGVDDFRLRQRGIEIDACKEQDDRDQYTIMTVWDLLEHNMPIML